jgi:hypothetical protein
MCLLLVFELCILMFGVVYYLRLYVVLHFLALLIIRFSM